MPKLGVMVNTQNDLPALRHSLHVNPQYLSLSKEDYEQIAGPGPETAITPYYELYVGEMETWLKEKWNEMVIS